MLWCSEVLNDCRVSCVTDKDNKTLMLKAIYQTNNVDIFLCAQKSYYLVSPNLDLLMIFLQMRYCKPEQSVLFKFHIMFFLRL